MMKMIQTNKDGTKVAEPWAQAPEFDSDKACRWLRDAKRILGNRKGRIDYSTLTYYAPDFTLVVEHNGH